MNPLDLQQARPMTQAELQKYMLDCQQAQPSTEQMLAMQNYWPPVEVPAGWVEWFAQGDDL